MTLYDSSDLGVATVMGTDDTGAAPLVGRGTAQRPGHAGNQATDKYKL